MRITCPGCGQRKASWQVISGSPKDGTDIKLCDDCAKAEQAPKGVMWDSIDLDAEYKMRHWL